MCRRSGEEEIGMMISQQQLLAVIRARSEPAGSVERTGEARGVEAKGVPGAGSADGISLSDRARDVVKITRALEEVPEIREDLVADIKERIEAGTYDISAEDVAEKIMGRALIDEVLGRDGPSR